jgi:hypothetical protein
LLSSLAAVQFSMSVDSRSSSTEPPTPTSSTRLWQKPITWGSALQARFRHAQTEVLGYQGGPEQGQQGNRLTLQKSDAINVDV